ncbi:MAG: oxidoreductase FAD/NAD(P)-binding domain protein [Rhodocyclaceae bacterium]|nr:oxidoreductase FAD/NAD(P)-binding domain protein [Rhodocyclaceae bacterium]
MNAYETRLEGREEVAEGTTAFHFGKPRDFSFKPGQAVDVVLPAAAGTDPQGIRHAFSLVSGPFEDHLTIATRMRDSAFKGALKALAIGSTVTLDGPFGALTLHNNRARPAVLIAGGIGITPFMSILRQAARDHLPQRLVLLYSNRRPEDAAFLAELQELEQRLENFRLVATMTRMDQSTRTWAGETGVIDPALVNRVANGLPQPICYLAGPPRMVEAMHKLLNLAGVDDDDIRSEDFYGY